MNSSRSGVVSLLDVLKFNAHEFVEIARGISRVETFVEAGRATNPLAQEFLEQRMEPDSIQEGLGEFPHLKKQCHDLMLDSAEDQVDRLISVFSDNPTRDRVAHAMAELQNRIEDQLARRAFYQLKPDVAGLFENPHSFGEKVDLCFPSAAHDIAEAGKCFACERFDATIYHLMRAMEVALTCLAKRLHVRASPSWGDYLNRIDKVLKSKARRSALRKSRLQFLGNAAALLRAVKEAWRDDTMHMAGKYGPDQTRDIFMSVKAFMAHLATELSEK